MRVALLGGRFDPPHNGHLAIARYVLAHGPKIDEVWLVPANTHPWRPIVASAAERLAMVDMLKETGISLSDIDIRRGGETYTIDTLRVLQNNTDHTYFWICGSDQLAHFSKWKKYQQLQQLVSFLVLPRRGFPAAFVPKNFTVLSSAFTPVELSSQEIRDRIQKGLPIEQYVPKPVAAYIQKRGLYRS